MEWPSFQGMKGGGQVTKVIQCSTTTFQLDYMNQAGKQRSQPMPHLNPNKSSPEDLDLED